MASTEPAKASIVDALIIMQEDFHSLSSFLPSLSQQLCRVTAPFWLAASHYNGSELEHASPALELVLIQASYPRLNVQVMNMSSRSLGSDLTCFQWFELSLVALSLPWASCTFNKTGHCL